MYPILIFILSASIFASDDAPEKRPGWLKLMRYTSSMFGYESEVQTEQYFFAAEGRKDPKAEYYASIKNMELTFTAKDDHPICLFPGRYLYLKKKLKLLFALIPKVCSMKIGIELKGPLGNG